VLGGDLCWERWSQNTACQSHQHSQQHEDAAPRTAAGDRQETKLKNAVNSVIVSIFHVVMEEPGMVEGGWGDGERLG